MRLTVAPARLAVCRLAANAALPEWARGAFVSITRTPSELSIVCDDAAVPEGVQAERGWQAMQVEGPIAFEITGVAAGLTAALAARRISVLPIATYDTDWLLVKETALDAAIAALREAGYDVTP